MSIGARVEKFNIVSNDHERTHKCNFSIFDRKFPILANLVKKNHNCQLKLKLGTQTNSIMQSSMFTFFVFDWNYPFCANLAEKMRIVNLS